MSEKPGKRIGVHSAWRSAFVRRVIDARNKVFPDTNYPTRGAAQRKMAEALADKSGRPITYDNYRKCEIEDAAKGGALLRQDLLVAFCEITRVNITGLLEGDVIPHQAQAPETAKAKKIERFPLKKPQILPREKRRAGPSRNTAY